MLAHIKGNVLATGEDYVLIEVGGLGYQVYAPLPMFAAFPLQGEEVSLHTHLQVREDSWQLFGFPDKEQLEIFKLLISVSGVGAKTALGLLCFMPPLGVVQAINEGNSSIFTKAPGIGSKTAQRIVLELKDKCSKLGYQMPDGHTFTVVGTPANDVINALMQLGYSTIEARELAAKAVSASEPNAKTEQLIMTALRLSSR